MAFIRAILGAKNMAPAPARLLPRQIDLYLLKTLFTPFLLIAGGIFLFLELERALRLVYELSATGADLRYFLPLLIELAPYFINMSLPPAFFLALILLIARLDDNLELQAMHVMGLSLSRIAFPLVIGGVIISMVSILSSGWLEPYGRHGFRTMRVEAITSGRVARVQPGSFYQPGNALFVSVGQVIDGQASAIFVWHRTAEGQERIATARSADLSLNANDTALRLSLHDGELISDEAVAGSTDVAALSFRNLLLTERLAITDAHWRRGRDERELTLPELMFPSGDHVSRLGRNAIEAERTSRLAKALLIPLLPFLVLPLTIAVGRRARLPGTFASGLIFVVAQHGLNFQRQVAAVGHVNALSGMGMVVGLFALIVAILFHTGRHLPSHSPMTGMFDALTKAMHRLTPRKHSGLLLRGRMLSTYLVGHVLQWTLVAWLTLTALLEMAEIFLRGNAFVLRGMGFADVIYYGLLRSPTHALSSLTAAALAGPMLSFFLLNERRELMSIQLIGISKARLLAMMLPVPLLLAAAGYTLAEHIIPASQQHFVSWWGQDRAASETARASWFRIGPDLVRVAHPSGDGRILRGFSLFRRDGDGRLTERVDADRAVAGPHGWQLENVRQIQLVNTIFVRHQLPVADWPTRLRPDDLQRHFSSRPYFSATWARQALRGTVPNDLSETSYRVRLSRMMAMPLAPFIMLLLAMPTISSLRRRAWPALAFAIGAGALFIVVDSLLAVLAFIGMLPILTGVWAVSILTLFTALTLLVYSER
ncbi:MAG: LptF/LptG family permease [Sphingopyxis sp.]